MEKPKDYWDIYLEWLKRLRAGDKHKTENKEETNYEN